jgi:hypothetical protein
MSACMKTVKIVVGAEAKFLKILFQLTQYSDLGFPAPWLILILPLLDA